MIAAIAVGNSAKEHQEGGINDRVCVEDPGQVAQAGIA